MSNESWENASPVPPSRGEIPSVSASAGAAPDLKNARRRKMPAKDLTTDRLPPYAAEAEQGVLGCVLLAPNECMGQLIQLGLDSDDFYDLRHQTIYQNLVLMYDQRLPIDIITLQQRIKDNGLLDEIGGIPYLNALQDSVPSAANLTYYSEIVKEKATLRRIISTCTDTVSRVYSFTGEYEAFVDQFERDVSRITDVSERSGIEPMGNFVNDAIEAIEAYQKNLGIPGAIATGFPDLDRMLLGGLKQQEMIVIAARPSMGKTSLLMNIMENICVARRIPGGVFSLEMSSESLTLRTICSLARVSIRNVTSGYISDRDIPTITNAGGRVRSAPLYIDDTPGLPIMKLKALARRMVQLYGVKVIGIDYLQLLHSTTKRAQENRQQEISEISSGIKELAKELDIPIIVLAQLNRDIEKDKNRKPRLSDLRESGAIEQDADVVGLLYRPNEKEEDNQYQESIPVNLLIAKQRNGPTGDVPLIFLKPFTRFESAARVDGEPETAQSRPEPAELPLQTEENGD